MGHPTAKPPHGVVVLLVVVVLVAVLKGAEGKAGTLAKEHGEVSDF